VLKVIENDVRWAAPARAVQQIMFGKREKGWLGS
jgi:hypothetical protein